MEKSINPGNWIPGNQCLLADLQPIHSPFFTSWKPGFQCIADCCQPSDPERGGIRTGARFSHVHHDMGQPYQYLCAAMGWSEKRPDLEPVRPQERMDIAGSTCSPDRVPVHTNCTKCVCNHGFYPDHQYRHGSLSITNGSLVGRSFPS